MRNRFLTVPIKLPSREKPTPEINRARVIPYFVLTQKYKTLPAIPKIIPTTAGILPFLQIVQRLSRLDNKIHPRSFKRLCQTLTDAYGCPLSNNSGERFERFPETVCPFSK